VDSLAKFLEDCNSRFVSFEGSFRFNEPMAAHTTFKTGGPADLWIRPQGDCFPEYAALLLESARKEGIPVFILGGGANLVVSDAGICGIVLDTSGYAGIIPNIITQRRQDAKDAKIRKKGLHTTPPSSSSAPLRLGVGSSPVCFRAGTTVDDAVELAAERGFSGLEFLAGMPGSMGGALWMNARCYDREMSDVVVEAQVLDRDGVRVFAPKKEQFAYKKSPFQGKDSLILAVSVALEEGDPAAIREACTLHRKDREAKGHYRFPSAGSVFKNNRAFGKPTGQIIDELGLKGMTVGGAQVAPWHGNIIINRGSATSADILALVETLEKRVKEKLGIELEREILFAGKMQKNS